MTRAKPLSTSASSQSIVAVATDETTRATGGYISGQQPRNLRFPVLFEKERNMTTPTQRWSDSLGQWAIPEEILAQAPENPWVHPPAMFRVDPDAEVANTPSTRVAIEALQFGVDSGNSDSPRGSVLDVGCGGGASSVPLAPFVNSFVGVDEQAAMLANYAEACNRVGVSCTTIEGPWLAVASTVPVADVVVCHHLAYNVADISPFLRELTNHARRRVVVELPQTHPTEPFNPLWKHFWNIERPKHPTAEDFIQVVMELGWRPSVERFHRPPRKARLDASEYVAFVRRRLCLPSTRDSEIATVLAGMDPPNNTKLVTVWWPGSALE